MDKEITKEDIKESYIEEIKEEAFLEGYQYAIKVLKESLVKKEKTE